MHQSDGILEQLARVVKGEMERPLRRLRALDSVLSEKKEGNNQNFNHGANI